MPPSFRPDTTAASGIDPAATELAHDLRMACMRIARRVRYETDGALPPHLFSILARLSEESRTVGDLADIERVSAPSMSRSLTRLCQEGLIQRSGDDQDGRVVRLSLTAAGRHLLDEERARRDAWMAERVEHLTPAQRTLLRDATNLLQEVTG